MIKLTTQISDNPDTLAIKNNIITINDVEFNLNSLSENRMAPCYKSVSKVIVDGKETGETIETIHMSWNIPKNRKFMCRMGNFKRFYNEDLALLISYVMNPNTEEVKASLKVIRDEYLKTHTLEEWDKKGL